MQFLVCPKLFNSPTKETAGSIRLCSSMLLAKTPPQNTNKIKFAIVLPLSRSEQTEHGREETEDTSGAGNEHRVGRAA